MTVTVTVLDLRNRSAEPPARPDGRIVVLDEAETLLKHTDLYQDLIGQPTVAGLICVAVGDAGPEAQVDGVALVVPAALRPDGEHRSAVLWVGDTDGLDWAPHSPPSFPETGAAPLDDLIAALQVVEVFDAVLTTVADIPGGVAGPAVRLAFGPAGAASIGDAAQAAARSLVDQGDRMARTSADVVRGLDAEHDPGGAVLSAPIAGRARDAHRRLDRAAASVNGLGAGWRLFGADRPTATVGVTLQAAARAAEAYRADADRLLNDMDRHLEEQRPPMADVIALGVAEPRPARGPQITTGLRALVDERLADGVTLPDLSHELQAASAFSAPQGVGALYERVRRVAVPDGGLPPFPRWPLSLWTLPLILAGCLACVLLAGPGTDGPILGGLLALVWSGAGWLLLARRPGPHGEQGFASSFLPGLATYGAAAAAGVAAGYVLRSVLTDPPVFPYPMILFGLLVLLAAVTALRGWRTAVRAWRGRLPLGALNSAVRTLDDSVNQACVTEWQPMRRRRAVAAAADAAAGGIEAIRRVLDETGDTLLPAPRHRTGDQATDSADRMPEAVLPELFQVVRGDLVELCRLALTPVWAAGGAPHGSADADVVRELRTLLEQYREHVLRHRLMSPFGGGTTSASREALMGRVWDGSPMSRTVLVAKPGDRMTQLCSTRQLGFLSGATEPRLLRFAPRPLNVVLRRNPGDHRIADDPLILWTDGSEIVGVLRLLALRPESIRYGWDGGAL